MGASSSLLPKIEKWFSHLQIFFIGQWRHINCTGINLHPFALLYIEKKKELTSSKTLASIQIKKKFHQDKQLCNLDCHVWRKTASFCNIVIFHEMYKSHDTLNFHSGSSARSYERQWLPMHVSYLHWCCQRKEQELIQLGTRSCQNEVDDNVRVVLLLDWLSHQGETAHSALLFNS